MRACVCVCLLWFCPKGSPVHTACSDIASICSGQLCELRMPIVNYITIHGARDQWRSQGGQRGHAPLSIFSCVSAPPVIGEKNEI